MSFDSLMDKTKLSRDKTCHISALVQFYRKYPNEASGIAFDEFRGGLSEMGVPPEKVASLIEERATPENIKKMLKMSDKAAFDFIKNSFERYLVEIGMDESAIRKLKFV